MTETELAEELEKLLLEYVERYGVTDAVRDFYARRSKQAAARGEDTERPEQNQP